MGRLLRSAEEVTPPPAQKSQGNLLVDAVVKAVNDQVDFTEKEIKRGVGSNLRDYLSAEELKHFTWLMLTAGYGDVYRYDFATRGNMTKVEHRHLKTAVTHLKKFSASVLDRIHPDDVQKVTKRCACATIKILDPPTLQKLQKATSEIMKHVVLERQMFEDLSELVMRQTCRNCGLDHHSCDVFSLFSTTYVPESEWHRPNCPYAYGDVNLAEKLDRHLQELMKIRDEQLDMLEKVASQKLKDEFTAKVDALNKSIELVVLAKNASSK